MAIITGTPTIPTGSYRIFDAANNRCYPGTGTAMTNLSPGSITGATVTGMTYSSTVGEGSWYGNAAAENIDTGAASAMTGPDTWFTWVSMDSPTNWHWWIAGDRTYTTAHSVAYIYSVGSYGAIRLYFASGSYNIPLLRRPVANEWNMLTVVVTSGNIWSVYLDDTYQGNYYSTSTLNMEDVGHSYNGSSYYPKGYIGLNGFWNSELTSTQIGDLYHATATRYGKG